MYEVKVHTVPPRILAAVGRLISIKDIPTAFKPALNSVWVSSASTPVCGPMATIFDLEKK